MEYAQTAFKACLHVTSADAVASILEKGLMPMMGPLSIQIESWPGVFMFASWSDMEDAQWLFEDAWPYESDPVLLAVNTEGLLLESEAGFEVVFRSCIEPSRITVMGKPGVSWDYAKEGFKKMGGRIESNHRGVIAVMPEECV